MKFEVLVEVRLRHGIADPQGATIERALPALGFEGVENVRVGKAIRLEVDAADEGSARSLARQVSDRLLANPVIEESEVSVRTGSVVGGGSTVGGGKVVRGGRVVGGGSAS